MPAKKENKEGQTSIKDGNSTKLLNGCTLVYFFQGGTIFFPPVTTMNLCDALEHGILFMHFHEQYTQNCWTAD